MKIVYSEKKSGKTSQQEVPKEKESILIGLKMGDTVDGFVVGLEGMKFQITGLSDSTGAPSRKEIDGTIKSRPLLSKGTGIRKPRKGYRVKRLIRGNTISNETAQINTVIIEMGSKTAEELFKPKEKKEE